MYNLDIIKTFLPYAHDQIGEVQLIGDELVVEFTVKIKRQFSLSENSFWSSSKVRHIKLVDYQQRLRQYNLDNLGL